jgi:hypothetical protein
LRSAILRHFFITEAIELRKNIFQDAPDVVPAILFLKKQAHRTLSCSVKVAFADKKIMSLVNNDWMLSQDIPFVIFKEDKEQKINLRIDTRFLKIREKLEKNPILGTYFYLKQGTKPYGSKDNKTVELLGKDKKSDSWDMAINGRNIGRYLISYDGDYVLRSDKLHSSLPNGVLRSEKIYFQRMRKISLFPRVVATYDGGKYHGLYTCSVIFPKKQPCPINLKYLLCILNSKLINLWYKYYDTDVEIKLISVSNIPVPEASEAQQRPFIEKANQMLALNKEFYKGTIKFIKFIDSSFNPQNASNKLKEFYSLDFGGFLQELKKQKVSLSKKDEYELMELFESEKKKALDLKNQIEQTDREINQMVYDLYGLTPEEIKTVESPF